MFADSKIFSESLELLREIISIPSPTFGEDEVCTHIASFLSKHEIGYERIANSLILRRKDYDPSRKTLMMCAHNDTVPPAEGYSFDPYKPEPDLVAEALKDVLCGESVSEHLIAGLGSNDDGGSLVSMLAAYRYLLDRELPFNLVLVISSEEERSGSGGMAMIHPSTVNPDWAIIGEPTGMKPATSERGLLVIDGQAEGISAHAARAEEGINALYIAIDDINRLRQHRFGRISPVMGEVKMNVTQINAGSAHNVIPGSCSFVVDIRPTEQYTNLELVEELQAICRSRLVPRNLKNRSSATPSDSLLMEAIGQLGLETFSSPTTSDWVRIGCEAIKMGPGESRRSHRKDEYITIDEIRAGVDGYIRFVECMSSLVK